MGITRDEHYMKLNDEPFELIKTGKKTIEVRCNDEKRRRLKVGDSIIFSKRSDLKTTVCAKIVALRSFASFEELYRAYDMSEFGASGKTVDEMLAVIDGIYSEEEQRKYGALAISVLV